MDVSASTVKRWFPDDDFRERAEKMSRLFENGKLIPLDQIGRKRDLARIIHALAAKTTIRALYQCIRQVLCLKRRFSGHFQELRQSLTFS